MKKKTTRTTKKQPSRTAKVEKEQTFDDDTFPVDPAAFSPAQEEKKSPRFPLWAIITVLLLLSIVVLFAVNRGYLFAAVVNGQPIFRWNLTDTLVNRYGKQTLEGMITEQLIHSEAQKQGVSVNQQEIDARTKQMLESFGSPLSVDELLKLQGMKRKDFDEQIRLQLLVQKLLTKDMKITDQDVDNYIATNRAMLVATDPAKLKVEAKNAIMESAVGKKLEGWLRELMQKASIQRFL